MALTLDGIQEMRMSQTALQSTTFYFLALTPLISPFLQLPEVGLV